MSQPLLPPAFLQNREFAVDNVLTLLLYGSFSAMLFLLPFDLIVRRGFSASEASIVFLPIGVVIGLASRSAGRWADKVGPRLPPILGWAIVALAAILLALSPANLWLGTVGPVLLMAIGMAMVVAPLTTAVMNAVPETQSGIASAVNNASSRLAGLSSVLSQAWLFLFFTAMRCNRFSSMETGAALWSPAGPIFASKGSARSRVCLRLSDGDADCRRACRSRR